MPAWMGRWKVLWWLVRPRQLFTRLYGLGWYRSTLDRLVDGLSPSGTRLLEVGCAQADLARSLADAGFRVTAVDRDMRADVQPGWPGGSAAHRGGGRLELMRADARALPLQDKSFDVVLAASLLNAVRDPLPLLREMVRVCRPLGEVRALVPLQGFTARQAAAYAVAQGWQGVEVAAFHAWNRLAHKMDPHALRDLFSQCGLQGVASRSLLGGMVMIVSGTVPPEADSMRWNHSQWAEAERSIARQRPVWGGAAASAATLLLAAAVSLSAGCAVPDAGHVPGTGAPGSPVRFHNNYAGSVDQPLSAVVRWQWEALRNGHPRAVRTPTPTRLADLALIRGYPRAMHGPAAAHPPLVTWIGHSTTLVQAGGLNVLTDPIFSDRASPVQFWGSRRSQPPGVALRDLPPVDVVLISHNHYDHLDHRSVMDLHQRAQASGNPLVFLVPQGLKAWFVRRGIANVQEFEWWQSVQLGGVEFHFTPVQHWSARGLSDQSRTLWGGWAVFSDDLHWFFSGDTGYSADFKDIRHRFSARQTPPLGGGFDLALIPVGAYEPRWFMAGQHINPAEAVAVHQDLGARLSVGIHWGTFAMSDEPLDQPPRDLAAARASAGMDEAEFILLAVGETRALRQRSMPR